jgi:hypothetical protein
MNLVAAYVTAALLATAVTACSTTATSGPFRDTSTLESTLIPGVTSPDDVRRLVGPPNGNGHAVGLFDYRPFDVWFYDDVAVIDAKFKINWSENTTDMHAQVRQQFLLVFFRNGSYQGHMWISNDSRVTGWVR